VSYVIGFLFRVQIQGAQAKSRPLKGVGSVDENDLMPTSSILKKIEDWSFQTKVAI
jgi:hypothetical protein